MGSDLSPAELIQQLSEILDERYGTATAVVHPQVLMDCRKCLEAWMRGEHAPAASEEQGA